MPNLMSFRRYYYLLSAILLIPGIIALGLWGLKLGIDFTGGSLLELKFERAVTSSEVKSVLDGEGFTDSTVQISEGSVAIIRTRTLVIPDGNAMVNEEDTPESQTTSEAEEVTPEATETSVETTEAASTTEATVTAEETSTEPIDENAASTSLVPSDEGLNEKQQIISALTAKFGPAQEQGFESIGPVMSSELTRKAVVSVLVASLAIILYIGWAFRTVPRPASSFRFGFSAILALLHDVLFLLGAFAIMGRFLGVEVNAMFVVAVLTVMGFSVHDSIVVFDRIREKLRQQIGAPFEAVVNESILETLGRSINTSLTVFVTLLALLLFGGEGIRFFTLALLLGVMIGSYSSIFNATPILVDWQKWSERKKSSN